MTHEVDDRIEHIFAEALARSEAERLDYVERACPGDPALVKRIRRLLASHSRAGAMLPAVESLGVIGRAALLAQPADPPGRPDGAESKLIGRNIDGFTIVRLLGTGGMGAVFEAEQAHPHRRVALKLMRFGAASPGLLRRFEFEAEFLGRLRHPGIAQIYQTGTFDDGAGAVPWFAMEYIPEARTILEHADANHLDTAARLALFADVCDAVHHGHQRGVIHRDLKPANILVDASGQPKIIDFGVARSTDSDIAATMHTQVGDLVGTILYMSPEQIDGDPHAIDTRSDVYSLGVILYELLAGRLPYDLEHRSIAASAQLIRESSPLRISAVRREFRGDIQTILDKAMEKDPARRYQSAAALAEDIRRRLRIEPIAAAPPSVRYRLGRFVRRNPVAVAAAGLVASALVVGFAVASWGWLTALEANRRSEAESARRQQALEFVVDLLRTPTPGVAGADARVVDALSDVEERIRGSFADDPAMELAIRTALGDVHFGLGLYDAAERQCRRAETLAVSLHGEASAEAAAALGSLGVTQSRLGQLEESERSLREAVARRAQAGVPRDDDHALLMSQLAATLDLRGRYDEAETQFREALALASAGSAARMESLAGLGVVAFRRRQFESALDYSQQALALSDGLHGPAHPDTVALVSNVAFFRAQLGDREGAQRTYIEAIQSAQDRLGEAHPLLAQLHENLGDLHRGAGRTDDAVGAYERALAIRRERFGDDHIATAGVAYKLAFALKLDDLERTLKLLTECMEPYRRHYGANSWEFALLQHNVGLVLGNLGRHADSVAYFQEAFERVPADQSAVARERYLREYIMSRLRANLYDAETERAARELAHVSEPEPDAAADAADAASRRSEPLFIVLFRMKRFPEAADLAGEVIAAIPSDEADHVGWDAMMRLARLESGVAASAEPIGAEPAGERSARERRLAVRGAAALAAGDAVEAERLLREALTLHEPADTLIAVPTLGRIEVDLAAALIAQGRDAEARALLSAGLEHLIRIWGEADWEAQRARRMIDALPP